MVAVVGPAMVITRVFVVPSALEQPGLRWHRQTETTHPRASDPTRASALLTGMGILLLAVSPGYGSQVIITRAEH